MRRAVNCFRCARSYSKTRYNLFETLNAVTSQKSIFSAQIKSNSEIVKLKYSTLPSSKAAQEKCIKELLHEYPQPKVIVRQLLTKLYVIDSLEVIKPTLTINQIKSDGGSHDIFNASLTLYWPEKFEVVGEARKKSNAEKIAYLLACQKLKEYGVLDEENRPILPERSSKVETKFAKSDLCNVFNVIWPKFANRGLIPKFETTKENGPFNMRQVWRTKLTLKYPEEKVFTGVSLRSVNAENIAAFEALKWLHEKGTIDDKKRPILHSQEDIARILDRRKLPYPLRIPEELKVEMNAVMTTYNAFKHENRSLFGDDMLNIEHEIETENTAELRNIITEKPYQPLTNEEMKYRSQELYQRQVLHQCNRDAEKIREMRLSFPIANHREDILHLIHDNRVVVLSGETGCGKSTQVPQYILDSFISEGKGSECSIVVTQPRRISAITIAEYVAYERGECVGQTIGHQIRLNRCLPENGCGAILFCTTGILLKKLSFNPDLVGISHVIIDEVHERSVQIDFLLIVLKNLLERNEDIKIIIMSASFNTHLISRYFDACPIIDIPGKIYPVKEYYLDDFAADINHHRCMSSKPVLDFNLLSKVIHHVDSTQPPGAILCFLPGWHEIKSVYSRLRERFADSANHMVFLLHSKLSPTEQKRVFLPVENGVRKIILSTNVAECSITINDVVYVIDCGFHKQTLFDHGTGTGSLDLRWISKANVKQRRGRAGRIQPGICYYVYPRSIFWKMSEYPIPEIKRISLEDVVLNCKMHCPEEKAADFLSQAPEHPNEMSIQMGIEELFTMDILDQNENLTTLGKTVCDFGSHPRLSRTLVIATFLRCIDPVLTISAFLTVSQDPFLGALEEREKIRQIKQNYDKSRFSDHLALYNLFTKWDFLNTHASEEEKSEFLENTLLDEDNLIYIKQLKTLFAENLCDAGLIDDPDCCTDLRGRLNQSSNHPEVIFAALTFGFYPNVVRIVEGKVSKEKIHENAILYMTVHNKRALPQTQSVVTKSYNLPSPYLVYFSALKSEARLSLLLSALSPAPGIGFPILAGKDLTLKTKFKQGADPDDEVLICIDDSEKLSFACSSEEAQLLSDWKHCLLEFFQAYLKTAQQKDSQGFDRVNDFLDSELLPILREVLKIPQVPFTRGKKYVRSKGEIVPVEL